MERPDDKYDKVMKLLRDSAPVLKSPDQLEEEVIKAVSAGRRSGTDIINLVEYIFGWTYNVWVRRSLIAASVILVIIFVFQQSIILNQISKLSRQINENRLDISPAAGRDLSKSMIMYRIRDQKFLFGKRDMPERKVEELFNSIDQLKKEYKDLQEMIDKDPELKKLVEKKLSEINPGNVKL